MTNNLNGLHGIANATSPSNTKISGYQEKKTKSSNKDTYEKQKLRTEWRDRYHFP